MTEGERKAPLSPAERAARARAAVGKRGNIEARRLKAFEDYWALGPKRTVEALIRQYREIAKREGPEAVPSLSKGQLLQWAKEDEWDVRATERDQRVYYRSQVTLEEARAGAFKAMGELVTRALDVVDRILSGREPAGPSVKLNAAKLVFEIAAIRTVEVKAEEKPLQLPTPPPPDAPDEAFAEYYRKLLGN